MGPEALYFDGDFEVILMSIVYKMQTIFFKNDSNGLILGTDTDDHYAFIRFGDPATCTSYFTIVQ